MILAGRALWLVAALWSAGAWGQAVPVVGMFSDRSCTVLDTRRLQGNYSSGLSTNTHGPCRTWFAALEVGDVPGLDWALRLRDGEGDAQGWSRGLTVFAPGFAACTVRVEGSFQRFIGGAFAPGACEAGAVGVQGVWFARAGVGSVGFVTVDEDTNVGATGTIELFGTNLGVGDTITVTAVNVTDPNGIEDAIYAYRWIRVGSDGAETYIAGATSNRYTLTSADAGLAVRVQVDFNDDAGNAESIVSASVSVRAAQSQATGAVTITGTGEVGSTLTAVTDGISDANGIGNAVFLFRWQRRRGDGTYSSIAGATSETYVAVRADAGLAVRVRVNFNDDDGNAEVVTSAALSIAAQAVEDSACSEGEFELWRDSVTNTVYRPRPACGGAAELNQPDCESFERFCVAGSLEFPGVLTDDGGVSQSEMLAELRRLDTLIARFSDGTTFGDTFSQEGGVPAEVERILDSVRRFSCLSGLGAFLSSDAGAIGREREWMDVLFPRAHAFLGGLFGGGFSIAALIPILKDILGVDIELLAAAIEDLCHSRAIEAAARGQVHLLGRILEQVAPPGSGSWAAGTPFVANTAEGADGLALQYQAHVTANPVSYSGSTSEALNRLLFAQIQGAEVMTSQIERLLGAKVPEELHGSGAVTGGFSVTEGDGSGSLAESITETDSEIALWYPFAEESDIGAEARIREYLDDVDIEALAREDLPMRPSGPAGASMHVQGVCLTDYPEPRGEDAEGLVGAMRQLRSFATYRIRTSNLGGWLCSLTPNFQVGGTVGDVCWDWGSWMREYDYADFSGFRHMCLYTTSGAGENAVFSAAGRCLYGASAGSRCTSTSPGAMPQWIGAMWDYVALGVQLIAALMVLGLFFRRG